MKTPEEIKQGLKCCGVMTAREMPCKVCPYDRLCKEDPNECYLLPDALALIERLEERIDSMLLQMRGDCGTCKHKIARDEPCASCLLERTRPNWEYEGFPAYNPKEV